MSRVPCPCPPTPSSAGLGLVLVFVAGCLRDPDRGGQEGEERWPDATVNEDAEEGADLGGGDGTGPASLTGTRSHLRGAGARGVYDCSLQWDVVGERTDWCEDCVYAFDLTFTLRELDSEREGYACGDVYGDEAATAGVIVDYGGYGPVVVARDPYTGEAYPLGPATIDDGTLTWSYGYVNESWGSSGTYYTWYWRVDVTLE